MESLPGYDAWKTRVPEDDSEERSGRVSLTIEREDGDWPVTAKIESGEVASAWVTDSRPKEKVELTEEEKEKALDAFERGWGFVDYYEYSRYY